MPRREHHIHQLGAPRYLVLVAGREDLISRFNSNCGSSRTHRPRATTPNALLLVFVFFVVNKAYLTLPPEEHRQEASPHKNHRGAMAAGPGPARPALWAMRWSPP